MRNIFKFNLLLLCLYSHLSWAHQYEFNDLVVFGDSLSDVGNYYMREISASSSNGIIVPSKMIVNDGTIYNEYLSLIFTGKKIYPSNQGGTNYANTNATVSPPDPKNSEAKSLLTMAQTYLENNNNMHISPKNLYIVWGGSNDIVSILFFSFIDKVNTNVSLFLKNKPETYDPLKYNKNYANLNIGNIAQGLIEYGAKYVIVPNIFDIGIAPQFNLLFVFLIQRLPIILSPISLIAIPLSGKFLHDYNNLYNLYNIPIVTGPGTGQEFIKKNLYTFLNKYGLIGKIAYLASNVASEDTKNFNYYLTKRLEEINGNIVFIDIYSLYNEIIDNPRFYGFDDILLPSCGVTYSRQANDIECKGDEYIKQNGGKTYLWSDLVHPSDFMHLIIAQYIQSIFNAPVLVSSITRQLDSFNQNNNEYIFNQLINFNSNNNIKQLIPFVSINGNVSKIGAPYDYDSKITYTNSLNIGFNYALNPKLLLGTMLNASYGTFKPYVNFKYRYNSQIFNLFSKYQYNNKLFFGVNFNLGRISANNIKRTITLGKGKLLEEGNTKGRSIGFNLIGAYNFQYSNNITLTPYISLNLNNYKVNGFSEKNHNSTAMRYANSSTTNKDIKLSLRATNHNLLNSFIELGLTQPINNNPIKIKSGLKSTKISFVREIYNDKKPSFNLAFGLNKKLKHNLSFNTSLNYKINTNKEQQLNYSLGINMKF